VAEGVEGPLVFLQQVDDGLAGYAAQRRRGGPPRRGDELLAGQDIDLATGVEGGSEGELHLVRQIDPVEAQHMAEVVRAGALRSRDDTEPLTAPFGQQSTEDHRGAHAAE